MITGYKNINCPKSQWAEKAKEFGFYLPQKLENKGRCGTSDKEDGADASYRINTKDGVHRLYLHNFRTTGDNQDVILIDDSEAPRKKKAKANSEAASGTDAEEQQAKERENLIARLQGEYCACKPATGDNAYLQRKGVPCVPGLRSDGQDLVIPFFDKKGRVVSLQRIKPDGTKIIASESHFGEGFFSIQGLPDAEQYVLVCEGLATGISLWYATYANVVVAGNAGKMKAGAEYAKEHFPGYPVICCADNDNKGDTNAGLEAARGASLALGCFLAVPPAKEGEKIDFNDLMKTDGRESVSKIVEEALKLKPVKIPDNFCVNKNGLFMELLRGKELCHVQISKSPLEVVSLARPLNSGSSWGLLVRWQDPDGCWQEALLSNKKMASDTTKYVNELLGISYITNWNKFSKYIYEYLIETETERRTEIADRCGWVGDLYITPNRCFGFTPNPVQANVYTDMSEFIPKGSLDDFKKLSHLAQGNHIFVTALSAACAAPLLGLANLESGGFHFVGQSSCGKTTALVMATAFWRNPKAITSWNTTDNALEFIASKYHDNLLTIDEISQVSSKALFNSLYMLSNGAGKKRCAATKTGVQEAAQRRWSLFYLSTGEEDIELKLRKDGFTPKAGQEVRLATVPVDDGHISNLHGYNTETELLTAVRTLCASSYGTAGEKFLEFLTAYAQPLREGLPVVISKYEDELCKPYCSDGQLIDNQVRRVATRFALCIVGGCLASAWGIIDISQDEIVQALTKSFASWIVQRGGTQSSETISVVDGMRGLLKKYGESFIVNTTLDDFYNEEQFGEIARKKSMTSTRNGIAGYIEMEEGIKGYYIDPDFFKNTLCREIGKNERTVKRILEAEGHLIPDKSDPTHKSVKYKPTWIYGWCTKFQVLNKRFYRIYYEEMFPTPEQSKPKLEDSLTGVTISFDI